MKIDNALVGSAIARFRELRGLTQAGLNDLVGLSTIQHIEQGRNAVSLDCLNIRNEPGRSLRLPVPVRQRGFGRWQKPPTRDTDRVILLALAERAGWASRCRLDIGLCFQKA